MSPIRLLIADNYQPFRQSLRQACELERGIAIVGEAKSGREAIALAQRLQPDVILIDVETPTMDGVDAINSITAQNPTTRVIALTTNSEAQHALEAIKAGAHGCLPKNTEERTLIEAIRAVHRGEALIDSYVTARVFDELRRIDEDLAPSSQRRK